uniref:Uncharacterized protein n=1 Tax=Anguilla anguilla TaxID=7936 RepID=A0A0E9QY16_ANGAN
MMKGGLYTQTTPDQFSNYVPSPSPYAQELFYNINRVQGTLSSKHMT